MKSLLIALSLVSVFSFAGLEEGTYKGDIIDNKKDVYLMLREAPGREGSFLAVLRSEDRIALYVLDKSEPHSENYVMTPLEVISDGIIGIRNDDPSLVLMMLPTEDGKTTFNIQSANSSNTTGFVKPMKFKGGTTKCEWIDLIPGPYKYKRNRDALVISNFNTFNGEADSSFSLEGINGSFVIGEQFPGMYTVKARSYTATGSQVAQNPRKIGVFIKVSGWGGGERFYLVNPSNDRDEMLFKLMD